MHHNLPEKKVERHSHADEHIIFIPLQGETSILLDDGKTLKAGTGKMIYLPADTYHSFESSHLLGERVIALLKSALWKKTKGTKAVPSVVATNQLCKELLFYLLLHPKTASAPVLIQTLIVTLSEALQASRHLLDPEHLSGKTNDPRIDYWKKLYGDDLTDTFILPETFDGAEFKLEEQAVQLIELRRFSPATWRTTKSTCGSRKIARKRGSPI